MVQKFDFDLPVKTLFGPGRLGDLHAEKLPGQKALIVISGGTSAKKYGYLEKLERELAMAMVSFTLFDEVRPNPTAQNIMDGAALARREGCDFVVALGGGSVMDCAKGIALMMRNPGHLWDYSASAKGGKKAFEEDAAPLVCVTTSAGTGSEVDRGLVISNDDVQEKSAFFHPSVLPRIAVVDATLMLSVPPAFTAYQGMDVFFHAAESYLNVNCNPIGGIFALKALALVTENLPIVCRDGRDLDARQNMALANTLAGYYMMCVSEHRMEHAMGSFHEDLPHGAGLIMISRAYFDCMASSGACDEKMVAMARAMGVEDPASPHDFVDALGRLLTAIDCADLKMSDYGITEEELALYPAKIQEVTGGNIMANPVLLTDEEYLEIFRKSYR